MPYFETDPDNPDAPVALESYGYGLRLNVRVVYRNPAFMNEDGTYRTLGMDPPLVLDGLFQFEGEGVIAVINDGEWEVSADNLALELCGFAWTDGWGEHVCGSLVEHEGVHRCPCDFTAPQ